MVKRYEFRKPRVFRNIMGQSAKVAKAREYFLDALLIDLAEKHGHKFCHTTDFAKFASKKGVGSTSVNILRLKKLIDARVIKLAQPQNVTASQARKLVLGKLKGKRYKNKELAIRELSEELKSLSSKLIKAVLDELILDGTVPIEQIATDMASQTRLRKNLARKKAKE